VRQGRGQVRQHGEMAQRGGMQTLRRLSLTDSGFVSIHLIEYAMYCKSVSLIQIHLTWTLYILVAIVKSFLMVYKHHIIPVIY